MPRAARIVIAGLPHHVTQRGNNGHAVFFADDDYRVYLRILTEQAAKHDLAVLGYCLLTNHVHVVGIPQTEAALAKAMGRTHFVYTQYVNRLHNRSGHLWQNRFYSCAMDDDHCRAAMRYVERNLTAAVMNLKKLAAPQGRPLPLHGLLNRILRPLRALIAGIRIGVPSINPRSREAIVIV